VGRTSCGLQPHFSQRPFDLAHGRQMVQYACLTHFLAQRLHLPGRVLGLYLRYALRHVSTSKHLGLHSGAV
jgi:hypothetical protein